MMVVILKRMFHKCLSIDPIPKFPQHRVTSRQKRCVNLSLAVAGIVYCFILKTYDRLQEMERLETRSVKL